MCWHRASIATSSKDLYPGIVALALIGLFNRRLGWECWMLLIVVGVGVVLSFGLYYDVGGWKIPLPY